MNKNTRILITGDSGFVGSHLVDEFVDRNYTNIYGASRTNRYANKGVKHTNIDLRNFRKTDNLISKMKPEIIYLLSANSRESTGEHSPIEMTTSGYNTFFNVITSAIKTGKLKKFIYISSAAVYGDIETPYSEKQRPNPKDIYAISKYANELSLQVLASTYKFSYVIIRPHNITGERQDPTDPTRNVVPMFMQLLRLGRAPVIYGNGSSVRCYTYVKDVTRALYKCLKLDNVVVNVGADKQTSIIQLYKAIRALTKIAINPEYKPARSAEVDINTVDHTHARKIFKPYKETSFPVTLKKTWTWIKTQPVKDFVRKKKEINL